MGACFGVRVDGDLGVLVHWGRRDLKTMVFVSLKNTILLLFKLKKRNSIRTVPAHNLLAPTLAKLIAAALVMPFIPQY